MMMMMMTMMLIMIVNDVNADGMNFGLGPVRFACSTETDFSSQIAQMLGFSFTFDEIAAMLPL